jgi:hypothetical protein
MPFERRMRRMSIASGVPVHVLFCVSVMPCFLATILRSSIGQCGNRNFPRRTGVEIETGKNREGIYSAAGISYALHFQGQDA